MDQLPCEVICTIFARFPFSKQKLRCMLVCKSWHAALHTPNSHQFENPDWKWQVSDETVALDRELHRALPFLLGKPQQLSDRGTKHLQLLHCMSDETEQHPAFFDVTQAEISCHDHPPAGITSTRFPKLQNLTLNISDLWQEMDSFHEIVAKDLKHLVSLRFLQIAWIEGYDTDRIPAISVPATCKLDLDIELDDSVDLSDLQIPNCTAQNLVCLNVRRFSVGPEYVAYGDEGRDVNFSFTIFSDCHRLKSLSLCCQKSIYVHGLDMLPKHTNTVELYPYAMISYSNSFVHECRFSADICMQPPILLLQRVKAIGSEQQ